MSPRSAQHEAILYIPGPASPSGIIVHSPQLLPSRSFWPVVWAIPTCHAREPSFLAVHETPPSPCDSIIVSLALQLARYMYINVPFFPCSSCFHTHPCPPQEATMRRRGVVCTPVSGSDRPIDSPPPNRDRRPASYNPAQLSLTRLQNKARGSASAETPAQFHPKQHRLQTRNTPAESELPGSPNSPCVSISCFLSRPHPR
jgi:hypothetical protein